MELIVLTLNLHTYQEHHGDLWHILQEHGREVYVIAEAIVHENIDVICFQEVGEHFHDHITRPYGFSLPLAVLLDLARTYDATDLPNRRPLALNPGGFGRQHVDRAPFDAPMRLFDTAIP